MLYRLQVFFHYSCLKCKVVTATNTTKHATRIFSVGQKLIITAYVSTFEMIDDTYHKIILTSNSLLQVAWRNNKWSTWKVIFFHFYVEFAARWNEWKTRRWKCFKKKFFEPTHEKKSWNKMFSSSPILHLTFLETNLQKKGEKKHDVSFALAKTPSVERLFMSKLKHLNLFSCNLKLF